MKYLLLILLFLCSCNRFCYFKGAKKIDLRSNPPGTVHLVNNLYIDRFEVSNIDWREYLSWTQIFDSSNVAKVLPDTSVWDGEYCNLFDRFSFRHPAFNNYPVVGVSYKQAQAFANWRTDRVNELIAKRPVDGYKKVLYRLPTKEEWELAASDGLDLEQYPYGMKKLYNTEGNLMIYCGTKAKQKSTSKLSSTESYCPNALGLYHTSGNLSEMIDKKGIAKGGNYLLPLDSCKIKQDHYYTNAAAWLGFRLVCEVLE